MGAMKGYPDNKKKKKTAVALRNKNFRSFLCVGVKKATKLSLSLFFSRSRNPATTLITPNRTSNKSSSLIVACRLSDTKPLCLDPGTRPNLFCRWRHFRFEFLCIFPVPPNTNILLVHDIDWS
jgi:hypothetical protein